MGVSHGGGGLGEESRVEPRWLKTRLLGELVVGVDRRAGGAGGVLACGRDKSLYLGDLGGLLLSR